MRKPYDFDELTTTKKVIGEGHAYDVPLRSITNVTYGDGP